MAEEIKRNFYCRHNQKQCDYCNYAGNLTLTVEAETDVLICPNNREVQLKLMGKPVIGSIAPKMTVDQIQTERKKRSSDHFKKTILPSFAQGSDEAKHFAKKTN